MPMTESEGNLKATKKCYCKSTVYRTCSTHCACVNIFTPFLLNLHGSYLMFFWPCIMNWLYIDYQLDAPIIVYS